MSVTSKISLLAFAAVAVFIGIKLNNLFKIPPLPKLEDTWWGPGELSSKIDTSITPFKINVPEKVIEDLKRRLDNSRIFTPPLEGIQQQYGMNTNLLTEIVEYWKTVYDWREREVFLNKYPQFVTNIQGLKIHFLHVKPRVNDLKVLPLLLLHGWPGSVREFYEIIPMLTTPRKDYDFVFEIIAPSLPGYGFSDAAVKPGLGDAQIGLVFKNLMARLGFEKYYVQGGDWGALIVAHMAALFPDRILGLHSNLCHASDYIRLLFGSLYPSWIVSKEFEHKLYPLITQYENIILESGYSHLHSTKPDTIGVGLSDSPTGLAAYILEKFSSWTNPEWKNRGDGGLKEKYTYTDLLDNIMIYWVTNSITTSIRLYSETFNKTQQALKLSSYPIVVPSACIKFLNEISYFPDSILKTRYRNLIHSADVLEGGHFAAFEVPEILARDIWTSIKKMEYYHKLN